MNKFTIAMVCAASVVAAAGSAQAADSASATYTVQQLNASTYRYSFTLKDTSTTSNVGTFWFSWIPGYNFMSAQPTNIQSPAGWTGVADNSGIYGGYSMEWYATSPPTGSIAPSGTLSGFQFDSTETPAKLLGSSSLFPFYPETYAYVYSGAPQAAGDSGALFQPTVAVPEPASLSLLGVGALMILRRRRAI